MRQQPVVVLNMSFGDTACIGAEFRRSRVGCLDPADTATTVRNRFPPLSVMSIHAEPDGHSLA